MNIKFEAVSKSFGKKTALKEVSFQLSTGEIIGFVGPNGAGKTTTMRLMMGYLFPEKGSIYYNGKPQDVAIPEVRKSLGYLPENNPLPEDAYVADYLEYQARAKGVKNEFKQVSKLAKKLDFKEYLLKPISALSKGYRQRVGLAAALLGDPEVLILDEPQEGLDPAQRIEIRQLIKDIGRERTVILSTHILTEVTETCRRIILIDNGKIILDDLIDRALRKFSTKSYSLEVKGRNAVEVLKEKFGQANIEVLQKNGSVYKIRVWSPEDIREEIFKLCVEKDLVLLELTKETASLEQIFLKLTEKENEDGAKA